MLYHRVIRPKEGSLYWYTGSSGSRPTFEDSGAIILTNGRLQRGRPAADGNVVIQHSGENRPIGRPLPNPDAETLNPDKGPGVEYETITRPPLAGPYAFSRLPRPVDNLPKIYLKNDLPATWLFTNTTTGQFSSPTFLHSNSTADGSDGRMLYSVFRLIPLSFSQYKNYSCPFP